MFPGFPEPWGSLRVTSHPLWGSLNAFCRMYSQPRRRCVGRWGLVCSPRPPATRQGPCRDSAGLSNRWRWKVVVVQLVTSHQKGCCFPGAGWEEAGLPSARGGV